MPITLDVPRKSLFQMSEVCALLQTTFDDRLGLRDSVAAVAAASVGVAVQLSSVGHSWQQSNVRDEAQALLSFARLLRWWLATFALAGTTHLAQASLGRQPLSLPGTMSLPITARSTSARPGALE